MSLKLVIRKEYKSVWEQRAPLNPSAVSKLVARGIPVYVTRADNRIYADQTFQAGGATLVDADFLGEFILGIKEPKLNEVKQGQVHLAFSHTIKGQTYNMPLLQAFLDRKATLLDYELFKNEAGKRLIAFGRYAGIAGAIDTFWVTGQKYALKQMNSPLADVKQTLHYRDIKTAEQALNKLAPLQDTHARVVIVGTGNVGRGCEEVCRWLGLARISSEELLQGNRPGPWYAFLSSSDLVHHVDGAVFDYDSYKQFGAEKYVNHFDRYLGKFDILMQSAYWEKKYPKALDRARMLAKQAVLPPVIGDISCDINGSLECTLKASTIDHPSFTYSVEKHQIEDGISWDGPTVMSVDNLPCELSKDASDHFSNILVNYVPELVSMDLSKPFESCGLSPILREATIVYKGELTPRFAYLKNFL